MATSEKDTVFFSKMKYSGIFSYSGFYAFAHDWISEEMGLTVKEGKYSEKIKGDSKEVEFEWGCDKEVTDYFKVEMSVVVKVNPLKNVEVNQGGKKISTNNGSVEIKVKGVLIKDYDGKFEGTAFKKFMRSVYEKWIIPSKIDEISGKFAGDCDEFLGQSKAYLDLEGKR